MRRQVFDALPVLNQAVVLTMQKNGQALIIDDEEMPGNPGTPVNTHVAKSHNGAIAATGNKVFV